MVEFVLFHPKNQHQMNATVVLQHQYDVTCRIMCADGVDQLGSPALVSLWLRKKNKDFVEGSRLNNKNVRPPSFSSFPPAFLLECKNFATKPIPFAIQQMVPQSSRSFLPFVSHLLLWRVSIIVFGVVNFVICTICLVLQAYSASPIVLAMAKLLPN